MFPSRCCAILEFRTRNTITQTRMGFAGMSIGAAAKCQSKPATEKSYAEHGKNLATNSTNFREFVKFVAKGISVFVSVAKNCSAKT